MKQLEVQIMGQHYLLACPQGGESHLLEAVERVDTAMCRIRDDGRVRIRERIAVLAALNLAFDLADRNSVPSQAAPQVTQITDDPSQPLGSLLQRLDAVLGGDDRLI